MVYPVLEKIIDRLFNVSTITHLECSGVGLRNPTSKKSLGSELWLSSSGLRMIISRLSIKISQMHLIDTKVNILNYLADFGELKSILING